MPWPIPRKRLPAVLSLVLSGLFVATVGCGSNEETKTKTEPEEASAKNSAEPASPQSAVESGPEAQLKADLEDAISLLEQGDVELFLENYAPLNVLGQIREEASMEQFVSEHKEDLQDEFLPQLQKLADGEIEFLDEDKLRAIIWPKQEAAADEPDDFSAPAFSLTDPSEEKIPHFEGFPGEVKEAIQGAIAALEAGDYKKFVENFFPESELARATSEDGLEAIAFRLKEHPEMAKRMIADLKALETLTPELDAQETVATFQMNPETPEARTLRLEKQGTWRLADSAKAIRAEMHKQSRQSLQPLKAQEREEDGIKWIRIRDHWRISDKQ